MGSKVSICAVIAVRNEASYLRYLLPYLAGQDIDVVIIDNGSSDSSKDIYAIYKDNPIIEVIELPYCGTYSQTEQLREKYKVYDKLKYDWVIHHDADEILQHRQEGYTLRNAIEQADESGYNVVNFEEFVFMPEPGRSYFDEDYYSTMLRYYFFKPHENRLNRAWKRSLNVTTIGGHKLIGDGILICPFNHILRHYIVLSQAHAIGKYLNRVFDEKDLNVGMHNNRLNFNENNLQMPLTSTFIHQLPVFSSKDFCRDVPAIKHFWEW